VTRTPGSSEPQAWTDLEREVLGINDTDRFIRELRRKLERAQEVRGNDSPCPSCGAMVEFLEAHLDNRPECRLPAVL
jgi:hypothetical protein